MCTFLLPSSSSQIAFCSYVVGIPMLLAAPDKFALCFTFGTACFLGAVVVLDGPIRYVRRLGSLHRMWPLVAVVATSVGTIVCSFGVQVREQARRGVNE
jgi:hypothetical protein